MDEYLGSWFAGSFWITGIFLCPLGGWLGGWFGRRKIILLASPLVFTGWTILGTAKNIHSIFLGRYISAMAVTCHMSSVGNYNQLILRVYRKQGKEQQKEFRISHFLNLPYEEIQSGKI